MYVVFVCRIPYPFFLGALTGLHIRPPLRHRPKPLLCLGEREREISRQRPGKIRQDYNIPFLVVVSRSKEIAIDEYL